MNANKREWFVSFRYVIEHDQVLSIDRKELQGLVLACSFLRSTIKNERDNRRQDIQGPCTIHLNISLESKDDLCLPPDGPYYFSHSCSFVHIGVHSRLPFCEFMNNSG
jgi:hypothetical protein